MLLEAGADSVVWQFIRASGLAAYILLTASVLLGLSVGARAADLLLKRAHVNEGHQTLAVLAGVLIAVHVAFLLVHDYISFSVAEVLIPFASGWRPAAVAFGIVSMYMVAVLLVTSFLRSRFSPRAWRLVHYAALPAWLLATGHGLFSGTDTGSVAVQYMYLAAFALVVLLLGFSAAAGSRLFPRPTRQR